MDNAFIEIGKLLVTGLLAAAGTWAAARNTRSSGQDSIIGQQLQQQNEELSKIRSETEAENARLCLEIKAIGKELSDHIETMSKRRSRDVIRWMVVGTTLKKVWRLVKANKSNNRDMAALYDEIEGDVAEILEWVKEESQALKIGEQPEPKARSPCP